MAPKKDPKPAAPSTPLDTRKMRTTIDGQWILVGTQKFKRTVLPSVAEKREDQETEKLLDELDEQDQ